MLTVLQEGNIKGKCFKIHIGLQMIFDSKYERDKSVVIILLHNIFNLVAER